ncbi:MAG TPA: tetratricopeptide repeat protein [Bryobacteraceae bacterium]
MGENVGIFLGLYYRPARALSGVLDRGSFAFAAILAVMVYFGLNAAVGSRFVVPEEAPGIDQSVEPGAPQAEQAPPSLPFRLPQQGLMRFTPEAPMVGLIPMAVVFVPMAALIIAWWDALGGAGVILRRDYMPLLVCCLMSWSAAYLPAAILLALVPGGAAMVGILVAGYLYFLVLAVLSVRTVMGTGAGHATAAVAGAWVAVGAATVLYSVVGGIFYYLASPMVLYFGYLLLGQDIRLLSGGLSSRQSLRRHLEASTLNPHDGDAQYQLGLIYQQRRNYTEAIPRFEKAIAIDPGDPDPRYQLGRILMEQKRYAEARVHFAAAAAANDKHSSSDVWRELGAADLELGETAKALAELEKFVDRREYDPEGLYLLGRALKDSGRGAEAKRAFERCVEAVQTMPSQRRRQTGRFKGLAQSELRGM